MSHHISALAYAPTLEGGMTVKVRMPSSLYADDSRFHGERIATGLDPTRWIVGLRDHHSSFCLELGR
jgi:hypothetical protein